MFSNTLTLGWNQYLASGSIPKTSEHMVENISLPLVANDSFCIFLTDTTPPQLVSTAWIDTGGTTYTIKLYNVKSSAVTYIATKCIYLTYP